MQYEIHLQDKSGIEMLHALTDLYVALGKLTLTDLAETHKIEIEIK